MKKVRAVGTIIALSALIVIIVRLFILMPPVEQGADGIRRSVSDPTFSIILFQMVIFAIGGALFIIVKKFVIAFSLKVPVKYDSTMGQVMGDLERKNKAIKQARSEIWWPLASLLFFASLLIYMAVILWPEFNGQGSKVLKESVIFWVWAAIMLFGAYLSDKEALKK
jgi:hypothetical protein